MPLIFLVVTIGICISVQSEVIWILLFFPQDKIVSNKFKSLQAFTTHSMCSIIEFFKCILRKKLFFKNWQTGWLWSGNWRTPKYRFQQLIAGCSSTFSIRRLIIRLFLWGRWQISYYNCSLKKLKADVDSKYSFLSTGFLATLLNYKWY